MTLNYSVGILGNMDISQFKSGINQIKQDLADTDTQTKKTGNTLDTFKRGLAGGLEMVQNLSYAAAGALTTIGLSAPSLSGSISRIKTEALKTSEILGREMQPEFESFATGWQNFNGWLDSHPLFKTTLAKGIELLGVLASIKIAWSGIKWLIGAGTGAAAAGGTTGAAGGTAATGGLLSGLGLAGMSTVASGFAGGWLAQKLTEMIGWTNNEGGLFDVLKRVGVSALGGGIAGMTAGAIIGSAGGPIGTSAGGVLGFAGGLLYGGIKEIWSDLFNKYDQPTETTTNIPITNQIYMDGNMIAQSSSYYQGSQMSYMPGGGD